jgi:hypothetical protein
MPGLLPIYHCLIDQVPHRYACSPSPLHADGGFSALKAGLAEDANLFTTTSLCCSTYGGPDDVTVSSLCERVLVSDPAIQ